VGGSPYDDIVMDHIRNARGYRALDSATHRATGHNPLCGDDLTVYAMLAGDRIEVVTFQCTCCGISMASASMMSEYMQGKSRARVRDWISSFVADLVAHAEPPAVAADPLRYALLQTVRDLPVRTPCAALPWATLAAALAGSTEIVTVRA